MNYEKELKTAVNAAKKAGQYLIANRGKVDIASYKDQLHNYATKQDIEAEHSIIDDIKKEFPEDQIFAEESLGDIDITQRLWIIDPIDGTRNYANGIGLYSVSIGFWDGEGVKTGAVYAPGYNNELFTATKGGGAFLNGEKIDISNNDSTLSQSLVSTAFPYDRSQFNVTVERIGKVLPKCADIMRFGSAALDMCFVAAGRLGAYFEEGLKPYDLAAGILLLEEAGGKASHFDGSEFDLFRMIDGKYDLQILAAKNPKIQEELIDLIG